MKKEMLDKENAHKKAGVTFKLPPPPFPAEDIHTTSTSVSDAGPGTNTDRRTGPPPTYYDPSESLAPGRVDGGITPSPEQFAVWLEMQRSKDGTRRPTTSTPRPPPVVGRV